MSTERRINLDNGHNKLKQVAGLVEKLSYSDMIKLEQMLSQEGIETNSDRAIAEIMLKVSERILAEPERGRH